MTKEHRTVFKIHGEIRNAIRSLGMEDASLIVAVSGGQDSLTLLYSMNRLKAELGLRLHGAHLNHKLRGNASDDDARFVKQTFDELEIDCTIDSTDVYSLRQEHGLSLEEAAREARYSFLTEVASSENAKAIVLGHTADDQVETVLMNIIRGTGLTGLSGMQPAANRVVNDQSITLVRPMLNVSRIETGEYCDIVGISPREDDSNQSTEFRRNRIRLELLPQLERYNPSVKNALQRLSRSASADVAFLEGLANEAWLAAVMVQGNTVSIDRKQFSKLNVAIQKRLLRRAIESVKGDLTDIEQAHIDDATRLMFGGSGKSLNLPEGITFRIGYENAILSTGADSEPLGLSGEHPIVVPGKTILQGWSVVTKLVEDPNDFSSKSLDSTMTALLDADKVGTELLVRSRRRGDRMQPLGMCGTKKLQDVMVDAKVPRSDRNAVPIVVSTNGIVWAVGLRIAEWAKVDKNSTNLVQIRFVPDQNPHPQF